MDDDLNTKLAEMTMVQLKEELKKRRLKTTGLKNKLILRLLAIMSVEREHGDPEQHDGTNEGETMRCSRGEKYGSNSSSSSDEDVLVEDRRQNRTRRETSRRNQLLTFRNVEESLETFSGDDKVDVTK